MKPRTTGPRAAKFILEILPLVLAFVGSSSLFSLAGISMPSSTQVYLWAVFFLCVFGLQRLFAGLLWFAILLAKPQWIGVGAGPDRAI